MAPENFSQHRRCFSQIDGWKYHYLGAALLRLDCAQIASAINGLACFAAPVYAGHSEDTGC
jgi:hypothetical protein